MKISFSLNLPDSIDINMNNITLAEILNEKEIS